MLVLASCGGSAVEPTPKNRVAGLATRAGFGVYDIAEGNCSPIEVSGLSGPVPIASAFKLWVLDTLARQVKAGVVKWQDQVVIRDELRSDPSGEVYTIADGATITVRRLAELMISISDNTAADHLIDHLGRRAVEATILAVAPQSAPRNIPLLSTADMARLKFLRPDLGREYLMLRTIEARRLFLARLPRRSPFPWIDDPAALNNVDLSKPRSVYELEWFATGTDLCTTMTDLARLADQDPRGPLDAILSANPGLPPGLDHLWHHTWFKGGSEPGVLALVFRLADSSTDRVVVVALSDKDHSLTASASGEAVLRQVLLLGSKQKP